MRPNLRALLPEPRGGAAAQVAPIACDLAPVSVAGALRTRDGFLWLDDSAGLSRLCASPLARVVVRDGVASITSERGAVEFPSRGFDALDAVLAAWGGHAGALLCGYFGYELGAELESLAVPQPGDADPPDLHLALYDWSLEHDAAGWRLRGTDAWREPIDLLPPETVVRESCKVQAGHLRSDPDEAEFCRAVDRTVARIYAGDLFQVNLCRTLSAPFDPSQSWPLYLAMRAASPATHGAFLRLATGEAVLSISPELFLRVRDGVVSTRPIKGTRQRGATPAEDERLRDELMNSAKDRAELAMIVDVARNDLGRVCVPGSVCVASHAELVTLPTVHHTVSEVRGRLRAGCGAADLLRAAFPAASISGAPKIHAMEVAAEEERRRRGPAMGAIGWISLAGDLELSVAIRTAVVSGGEVRYLAGCGITAESKADEELAESAAKAAAFRQALGVA